MVLVSAVEVSLRFPQSQLTRLRISRTILPTYAQERGVGMEKNSGEANHPAGVPGETPSGGPGRERFANLPAYRGSSKTYLMHIRKEKIGYVNAILESFDDLARIRTKDNVQGVLEIVVPSDWDAIFHGAVQQLAREMDLRLTTETGEAI
jgi:hypothetical protein